MKKIIEKLLPVFLIFSLAVMALSADFRGLNWGASMAEVEKTESVKAITDLENMLIYNVSLYGFNASRVYKFTEGKLSSVLYLITAPGESEITWLNYSLLKNDLLKKYGKPQADTFKVVNSEYENNKELAFKNKDFNEATLWVLERTGISFLANFDKDANFEINILYLAK